MSKADSNIIILNRRFYVFYIFGLSIKIMPEIAWYYNFLYTCFQLFYSYFDYFKYFDIFNSAIMWMIERSLGGDYEA